MLIKNKRGVSQVVTIVILILLVLIAIGILWALISTILSRQTGEARGLFDCFDAGVQIDNARYEAGKNSYILIVSRISGKNAVLDRIAFKFNTGELIEREVSLGPFASQTIEIDSFYDAVSQDSESVQVSAILADGRNCPLSQEFNIDRGGTPSPVITEGNILALTAQAPSSVRRGDEFTINFYIRNVAQLTDASNVVLQSDGEIPSDFGEIVNNGFKPAGICSASGRGFSCNLGEVKTSLGDDRFSVNVTYESSSSASGDEIASFSVGTSESETILSDNRRSVTINFRSGGGGDDGGSVCGNNVCEPGETSASCSADCVCSGDVNNDLVVNDTDLDIYRLQFGNVCANVSENQCTADVNNDGTVNGNDGTIIYGKLNTLCGACTADSNCGFMRIENEICSNGKLCYEKVIPVCNDGECGENILSECALCATGCINGEDSCNDSSFNICTDSDGGIIPKIRGNTLETNRITGTIIENKVDVCIPKTNNVTEYACAGSDIISFNITCGFSCSNGACSGGGLPSTFCRDSDFGLNTSAKGKVEIGAVSQPDETFEDFCLNSKNLVEYACAGDNDYGVVIECPGGCSNGVCFTPPTCQNDFDCPIGGQTCSNEGYCCLVGEVAAPPEGCEYETSINVFGCTVYGDLVCDDNYLINGGFEEGESPWGFEFSSIESVNPYSGNYHVVTANIGFIRQNITLGDPGIYELCLWAKAVFGGANLLNVTFDGQTQNFPVQEQILYSKYCMQKNITQSNKNTYVKIGPAYIDEVTLMNIS
jgi:hypothetical protein